MTSSRSASVLDGMICSSGTSSPVPGSRYCTKLWWLSCTSSSTRMPVERRISMVAQAQNARSSSAVRLRRFPLAGSPPRRSRDAGGGRAEQRRSRGGDGVAGPGVAGGLQQGPGVGVLLGGGADQDRQDREPFAGPGVHPRLAVPLDLALDGVRRADGTGSGPWPPPGGVIDGPLGQVEVEGPDRGQELAVADPLGVDHGPDAAAVVMACGLVRMRCFQASATSALRCRLSIPGWWASRSAQNMPRRRASCSRLA